MPTDATTTTTATTTGAVTDAGTSAGGRRLPYGLVDADNHYYEPKDCFTRFLTPAEQLRSVRYETGDDGQERIWVGDRLFTFLEHRGHGWSAPPGSLRAMLQAMKQGDGGADIRGTDVVEPWRPEYTDRDARLAVMDAQGVDKALLFPTLGVCVEGFMDDPGQIHDNLHAFNRWLDEDWGFAWRDRIYAPPLISLADRDRAVAELDWAIGRGARVISIRPGPAYGRSPADPWFDPFWARVDEARLVVGFHIGESSYNEKMSVHWGEDPNPPSHRQSALQWTCFYGDRPIMETIAALIYHNLFGRFPNVRVLSVENGSLWVDYLMRAMNKMNRMARNGPWPGGPLTEKPSDTFRRHVFVSPYHEEPVEQLCGLIGTGQVLFGSDWPHTEGLADPRDFADTMPGLSDDDVRRVMRDNTLALLAG
jgi:predicted TIM-barrel fold metal-dependent hydrolase